FERYLATREANLIGKKVEVPALRKDGSTVQVEIALSALPKGEPSEGELYPPVLFLAAIRDLSERDKMRSIVLQSEKLASIGLLSAGIAHEINNPLSFVANNLAVLERDTLGLLRLIGMYKEAGKLAPELARKIGAQEDEIDLPYLQKNLAGILQRTRDGVERVSRIIHSLRGLARTEAPEPR